MVPQITFKTKFFSLYDDGRSKYLMVTQVCVNNLGGVGWNIDSWRRLREEEIKEAGSMCNNLSHVMLSNAADKRLWLGKKNSFTVKSMLNLLNEERCVKENRGLLFSHLHRYGAWIWRRQKWRFSYGHYCMAEFNGGKSQRKGDYN